MVWPFADIRSQTTADGWSVAIPINSRSEDDGFATLYHPAPPRHHWTWGFAMSSIPNAFITAIVVFKVGLPFALNER